MKDNSIHELALLKLDTVCKMISYWKMYQNNNIDKASVSIAHLYVLCIILKRDTRCPSLIF